MAAHRDWKTVGSRGDGGGGIRGGDAELIARLAHVAGCEVVSFERLGRSAAGITARVELIDGTYFAKCAPFGSDAPLIAEAHGLELLADAAHSLQVPTVRLAPDANGICDASTDSADVGPVRFLLMDWIESEPGRSREAGFMEALGAGLAEIHDETGPGYGLDRDNFIGAGRQSNPRVERWDDFFAQARIQPMVAVARNIGVWSSSWDGPLARLLSRLPDILPHAPNASLVHGDLWSGNVLAPQSGAPAIIDPAVYYGHSEVDLAMTELFGGFTAAFYTAYAASTSAESGYEERREIYNLYHLINHLNLFGRSYASRVEQVLARFG